MKVGRLCGVRYTVKSRLLVGGIRICKMGLRALFCVPSALILILASVGGLDNKDDSGKSRILFCFEGKLNNSSKGYELNSLILV